MERRGGDRVNLHSIAKISDPEHGKVRDYYGYIENLSETGIGLISTDVIPEGERMECTFFMEGVARKLSLMATLVNVRAGEDRSYHYGFRFEYVDEADRRLIKDYISSKQFNHFDSFKW